MSKTIEKAIEASEKLWALRACEERSWADMDVHEKELASLWGAVCQPYAALFGRRASAMGTQTGPGWWEPLVELFDKLGKLPNFAGNFEIVQIKEKFGGLRCYFRLSSDDYENMSEALKTAQAAALELVREAERACSVRCEWCGEPGIRRNSGWIKTACDKHAV